MAPSSRRVVITGMGLISPLGNSVDDLWRSLSTAQSGIARLEQVPTEHLPTDIGGEARNFTGHIDDFGPLEKTVKRSIKKGMKLMCREIQMGVAAAQLAMQNACLSDNSYAPERIGTMFGSDYIITLPGEFSRGMLNCLNGQRKFEFDRWAEKGLTQVEPLWLLKYLPNMPASHVAIYNDLRGPSNSLTVREASANLAIAEATTIVQRGAADIMVTGSTGSRINPLRTVHVALQEQLADCHQGPCNGDPGKASRPFELDRQGMVLGEGAGVIILEDFEYASQRGANIVGEVIGYSSSSVADRNGVADYQTAIKNVVKASLDVAGLTADQVGHVNAHGLSAPNCDRQEARAIAEMLGDKTPVAAVKSYMGNLGAGSGVVELIASVLALNNDQLFPTLNYDRPDPECPINVVDQPQSPGTNFLSLNITPQGQASAVIIQTV